MYPRAADEDEDDLPSESGSIFNFFTVAKDTFDVSGNRSFFVVLSWNGVCLRVLIGAARSDHCERDLP